MSKEKTEKPKESKDVEQEMQQRYVEMQMLSQQARQLQQQMQQIEAQNQELEKLKQAFRDFEKLHGDEEILFPISSGIYAQGNIVNKETLLVNVGSNVMVEKTTGQTKELIEEQKKEISKVAEQVMTELTNTAIKLQFLESEMEKLQEQLQKEAK